MRLEPMFLKYIKWAKFMRLEPLFLNFTQLNSHNFSLIFSQKQKVLISLTSIERAISISNSYFGDEHKQNFTTVNHHFNFEIFITTKLKENFQH